MRRIRGDGDPSAFAGRFLSKADPHSQVLRSGTALERTVTMAASLQIARNRVREEDWACVLDRLTACIEGLGVRVESAKLGPQTTGVFDGASITTNADCDVETRCHNVAHALGHIVQWSVDGPRCEALYEELNAAKAARDDSVRLNAALQAFRSYEEQASGYAVWLLAETGCEGAIESFTRFARADIEAIVTYHREGAAPIWSDFFTTWNERVARGEVMVQPFDPEPIPTFSPRAIAPQEVIRGVREPTGALA